MRHLLFLAFSTLAAAQPLTWRELPATGEAPSGRVDGSIAYDQREKRIYMFGGRDSTPRNDLWSYSIDAGRWTQMRPSGTAPAARFGHTLLFDQQRRRLLVFGGQAGGFFSDTWAYDIARNAWQQVAAGGSGPNERYGHSAVLDAARDRMIISHGFTDEGRFDDTWALNLTTGRWQDISPASGRPLRRCLHHAVLDPEGNQMLLYGGCASGFGPCPLGDLWSFDLTSHRWTEKSGGLKPPERQWYGMGFDTARRRLLLFAGSGSPGNLNDTWEYDPVRGQWAQMRFTPAPAARSRHEAVYAPGLGTVFFGGTAADGLSNNLLLIAAPPSQNAPRFSSAAVVNAFSGNGGPLAPGEIISIYGEGLGPFFGTSATLDSNGNLPASIAGTRLTLNGIPAPLFYAQFGQINAQVPHELSGAREAEIVVTYEGRQSSSVTLPVESYSPGLYPSALRIGETVVIFATGVGPGAPIELHLDGQQAVIESARPAPQTIGVLQIIARATMTGNRIEATLRVGAAATTATLELQ